MCDQKHPNVGFERNNRFFRLDDKFDDESDDDVTMVMTSHRWTVVDVNGPVI